VILKPKDMPQRKRKKNHTMRTKTRKKRGMVLDLDKWARREIVELRDENICQRCGAELGWWDVGRQRNVVIQWAHVNTREYYVTRWDHDNSLALCDVCHVWFDNHKVLSLDWFAKKFGERYERIKRILQGDCKTTDAQIRELWLENCGRKNGD
jgi:hypothetical protein